MRNLVRGGSPPDSVVFASTAAVCPDRGEALSESVPPGPLDVYGETKLEGERLFERFAAPISARCVAALVFNVIGPREKTPVADVTTLREDVGSTPFRDVESSLAELLKRP